MKVAIKSLTIVFYKKEGMYQATVLYKDKNIDTYCGSSLEEVVQRIPMLVTDGLQLYKTRDDERVSALFYR